MHVYKDVTELVGRRTSLHREKRGGREGGWKDNGKLRQNFVRWIWINILISNLCSSVFRRFGTTESNCRYGSNCLWWGGTKEVRHISLILPFPISPPTLFRWSGMAVLFSSELCISFCPLGRMGVIHLSSAFWLPTFSLSHSLPHTVWPSKQDEQAQNTKFPAQGNRKNAWKCKEKTVTVAD